MLNDNSEFPAARPSLEVCDALEQGYEVLSGYGHRLNGGPYGHAPMVIEALDSMGRADAIPMFLETALQSGAMVKRPPALGPIDPEDPVFGEEARETDWAIFFQERIEESGPERLVRDWLPVLSPTAYSAAGHALIRVGHAVRAVRREDTRARRGELARALGSWASMHHRPKLDLTASENVVPVGKVMDALPMASEPASTATISGGVGVAFKLPGFEAAVRSADLSNSAAADRVLTLFASLFVEKTVSPFTAMAYCHAVTATAAAINAGVWLPAGPREALLRTAFATGAAIHAGFNGLHPSRDPGPDPILEPAELIDAAVSSGADHAIKFTEACVTAYMRTRDPVFLASARRGLRFLDDEGAS